MKASQPRFQLREAVVDWEANANRGLARAFCGQLSVLCDLRHMSADAITETNAITHALGYKIL